MIYWILLYVAIVFEVAGTTAMKLSHGFTQTMPTLLGLLFYILSVVGLTFALKKLEMGPAYAIWSGLGTTFVAIIGVCYFQDQLTALKLASLMLVILGVVGLNLAGLSH